MRCVNRTPVAVLIALTCAACGGSEGGAPSTLDIVRGDSAVFVPVEMLGPVDTMIGAIRSMANAPSGYWAAVSGSAQLALFHADGSPQAHLLSRGNGPDQANGVGHVDSDDDGNAIIWDGRNSRLLRVTPAGAVEIIRTGEDWAGNLGESPRQSVGGTQLGIAVVKGGVVAAVVPGRLRDASDYSRMTLILDTGNGRRALLSFEKTLAWLDSLQPKKPMRRPFPLWTRCGREKLAIYDPRTQSASQLDLTGRVLKTWPVPKAPVPLSEREVRLFAFHQVRIMAPAMVSDPELRQMVLSAPAQAIEPFATLAPAYSSIQCTSSGTILLQRFEVSDRRASGTEFWDVVGDSTLPKVFRLPANFRLRIAGDTLLVGVVSDLMDVPHIGVGRWPGH